MRVGFLLYTLLAAINSSDPKFILFGERLGEFPVAEARGMQAIP
jgi:hypothetical protein